MLDTNLNENVSPQEAGEVANQVDEMELEGNASPTERLRSASRTWA